MWSPTYRNLSCLVLSSISLCSYFYWYTTLNSCKYFKSETHLQNAQINKASSVNEGVVKICLFIDMVRKNWLRIVFVGCGLHYFVSAHFGSFWIVANFSTAERFKNLFFTAIKFHTIARIVKKKKNFIFSSLVK